MPTKKRADPDAATYAGRLNDLEVASRAIGTTAAARLQWLLGFLAEEPARWHPAVRLAHGDCLVALGHVSVTEVLHGGVRLPDRLTPDQVDALHAELRVWLRDLLGRNPTSWYAAPLPTEGFTPYLLRLNRAGEKPAQFEITTLTRADTPPRTAILHGVALLIANNSTQLLACPSCGSPFIAIRKQEYCRASCAQRARNKKRDDTRPRKTERRKGRR